ncbi:acyl-coenzyme A synthetase/AMP-(fatty) acid ligase [Lysinibacillus composti]|nr:hypothetical protein [Lysinibacillus composti]MBM7606816.1 acyl-coenzyme A synthetase/AMP-(fatty) acid ligase [Lysinibacillus composti]
MDPFKVERKLLAHADVIEIGEICKHHSVRDEIIKGFIVLREDRA